LRSVALRHFNRQRLEIVLEEYCCGNGTVLTPSNVAERETFLPLVSNGSSSTEEWLSIGSDIHTVLPNGLQSDDGSAESVNYNYLMRIENTSPSKPRIHLTFLQSASGVDLVRGMLHANLLHQAIVSLSPSTGASQNDDVINTKMESEFPQFLDQLHTVGWTTDSTNIEPRGAVRFALLKKQCS